MRAAEHLLGLCVQCVTTGTIIIVEGIAVRFFNRMSPNLVRDITKSICYLDSGFYLNVMFGVLLGARKFCYF